MTGREKVKGLAMASIINQQLRGVYSFFLCSSCPSHVLIHMCILGHD